MSTSNNPIILGFSGTFASGKDTIAEHLESKFNFYHVSLGNLVRDVARTRYGSTDRSVLHRTGNELRAERGAGVLALLAIEKFKAQSENYRGLAISGVRAIGEVDVIKEQGGQLIFTDADIEIRYQRAVDRARTKDGSELVSLEDFKATEEKELNESADDPSKFNILGIKEKSDITLTNNAGLEPFLEEAVNKLGL